VVRRYLLVFALLIACKSHEAPPHPSADDLPPEIHAEAKAIVADKHATAQAASGAITVTRAWRYADAPQLAAGRSWVAVDVDFGTYAIKVDDVEIADADIDPKTAIAAIGDFKRLDPDGNVAALYGAHANENRFVLYFDVPANTKHLALLFAGEKLTAHAAEIADSGPTFAKPQRSVIRHFADGTRHVLVYEDFNQEDPPNTLTNHVQFAGGECAIRGVVPVDHELAPTEPPLAPVVPHAFYVVDYTCEKPPTTAWFDVRVPAGETLALPAATLEALEGRGPGITIVPATDAFTRVVARRDGSMLAIAPIDGAVQLVDPAGKEVGRLAGIHERVQQLGFTPDGKQLWLVEETGDVLVWDVTTHAQLAKRKLDAPPDMYSRPVMASDGRMLVVDHPWNKAGETMVAWSGQVTVLGLPALTPRANLKIISGNDGSIGGLDVSPDGKRLVVCAGTKNKSWARVAGLDGHSIATIPLDNVEAGVCGFTADGRIVIGDANGTVSLYDAAGRRLSSMHGNDGGVYELGRRADGSFLTGGADGKLLLWPRAGGKPQLVGAMKGPVRAIETLDDLVISHGMYDLTVRDIRGKLVARLYAGPDQSDSMAVAPGLVAIVEPMIAARTARVRIWHTPAVTPP
jgi:hypothetical protein